MRNPTTSICISLNSPHQFPASGGGGCGMLFKPCCTWFPPALCSGPPAPPIAAPPRGCPWLTTLACSGCWGGIIARWADCENQRKSGASAPVWYLSYYRMRNLLPRYTLVWASITSNQSSTYGLIWESSRIELFHVMCLHVNNGSQKEKNEEPVFGSVLVEHKHHNS